MVPGQLIIGIYCTFGGQTALNVGVKLKDEFLGLGVQVLGTPIHSIEITEDRELFNQCLEQIGEKTAMSFTAVSTLEAIVAANKIGYPLIIRAAYALGGLGSGFAENEQELRELCAKAFATSSQVLVERSMKGWKEIEYEVVRDCHDNCITGIFIFNASVQYGEFRPAWNPYGRFHCDCSVANTFG